MGSSDSLDIKVSGSASVEGGGMAAKAAKIRNDGSGLVRLGVLGSLDAELYSSGGVQAIKWAKLTQHRHGVGQVSHGKKEERSSPVSSSLWFRRFRSR